MIAQLLANGLIAGSIYALVAAGFALVYMTCRFIHFAHGVTVAVSAYALFWLFTVLGLNFWLAVPLAIAIGAGFGWLMHATVYKKLRSQKASSVILLLASFALLIFMESLLLALFGADVKTIGFIKVQKGMEILGAIITPLQIVIVVTALVLLAALYLFMKKTRTGRAMRAVADNKEIAQTVGVSVERTYAWAFLIGSAIAGAAGILVGLEQNLEPMMGTNLMIKGFTGAVVGGIGSVPGAILGAFLLGFAENIGIWFLPSGYKDAIAFVILFAFLLFRPQGILGIRKQVVK